MSSNMASDLQRQLKFTRSPIPRSRSDFNYVSLTPREKRKTTDFSHLLPQFNKEPPYVRLLDTKVVVVEQPTSLKPVPTPATCRMCRSATSGLVAKSPQLDVVRSQSLRSLRRTLEMSPSKQCSDESINKKETRVVPKDLPLNLGEKEDSMDEMDLTRLRNFSMTSKGLVNWGDSFRSRSMPFVSSFGQPSSMRPSYSGPSFDANRQRQLCAMASASCSRSPSRHKIVILGSSNVGKTAMIKQFRTSEYLCAFDGSNGSEDMPSDTITVVLNGEESELEFVDSCSLEEETDDEAGGEASVQSKPYIPTADAYVVVYSVTSRRSFLHALKLVSRIQNIFLSCVVILVGNKSDLVRIRAVTTDEGRVSSKERNCHFLETSVAINHQVDELLVSILTEIRSSSQTANQGLASKLGSPHHCSLTRAKSYLKKFLKKACFQSKSCDNLQRL